MDTAHQILYRIRSHIGLMGTSLTKIGEVIGSRAKSRQSKITTAKGFLAGQPRSFSLERIEKLSKFYGKDFFSNSAALKVAASKSIYGLTDKVEKATERQLDKMLIDIADHDPTLLRGSSLSSLSADSKRLILRAYYR